MKMMRKPIEVVAWFDLDGNPVPVKFRYCDDREGMQVVRIGKVLRKDVDKFAGNKMIKYTCESFFEGHSRVFEMRYEVDSCKWYLYKI